MKIIFFSQLIVYVLVSVSVGFLNQRDFGITNMAEYRKVMDAGLAWLVWLGADI